MFSPRRVMPGNDDDDELVILGRLQHMPIYRYRLLCTSLGVFSNAKGHWHDQSVGTGCRLTLGCQNMSM